MTRRCSVYYWVYLPELTIRLFHLINNGHHYWIGEYSCPESIHVLVHSCDDRFSHDLLLFFHNTFCDHIFGYNRTTFFLPTTAHTNVWNYWYCIFFNANSLLYCTQFQLINYLFFFKIFLFFNLNFSWNNHKKLVNPSNIISVDGLVWLITIRCFQNKNYFEFFELIDF